MKITRRNVLAYAAAAPAILKFGPATAATALKISHQFPDWSALQGDFRDKLCRKFADTVAQRSGGQLTAQVYPGSSLMKTNSQVSALRKGALDFSLIPLSYAGGDSSIIREWRAIARDTAWKDYANKSENCARLMKLAMDSGA